MTSWMDDEQLVRRVLDTFADTATLKQQMGDLVDRLDKFLFLYGNQVDGVDVVELKRQMDINTAAILASSWKQTLIWKVVAGILVMFQLLEAFGVIHWHING